MKHSFSILLSSITALFLPQTAIAEGGITVVELFTSQGCSSCPPADKVLSELEANYGDNLLPLSYHVDYWNYIGWTDPFSKPQFTQIQREYAAAMFSRRVYTPQMVINGRHDVVGSRRHNVLSTIVKAKGEITELDVQLTPSGGEKQSASFGAYPSLKGAEVLVVSYLPTHTNQVDRGENSGRTLTHHNIVHEVQSFGRYDGKAHQLSWANSNALISAILLKDPDSKHIVAAKRF